MTLDHHVCLCPVHYTGDPSETTLRALCTDRYEHMHMTTVPGDTTCRSCLAILADLDAINVTLRSVAKMKSPNAGALGSLLRAKFAHN